MDRLVNLTWDFRGPHANRTAQHHEIHLKEFIEAKNYTDWPITGTEKLSESHSIAFWVIPESQIQTFKDILKPHRATLYKES